MDGCFRSRAVGSIDRERLHQFGGIGSVEVRKKDERVAVNPTTGKRYLVPPKLVPVFKPASTLKNRLKAQEEADNE